ncbi:nicotinate-nucleotide adenylyltransferase [Sulfuricystis multivorans]|uniref:nicotinate-nucleotide adenylyltransferase n=1 Tax=Sulfuricystis multivorans TaxID=2211108 RepID=UPI0024DF6578|nr:nicotinate-nucleotide adenylyltransferase [Sulfuricystis multivorans]
MLEPLGTASNDAVGIMGGTFDPVHRAHLALGLAALDRLGLVKVRWIPAGHPPHRAPPRASVEDRLAMVRLAIAGEPRYQLDDSEAKSALPSYTVNTLERLRRHYGSDRPLVLLMGADAFYGLPKWHRWEDILRLAHIAVATRPGFPLTGLSGQLADLFGRCRLSSADFSHAPAGGIHAFELIAGTVSATEVRRLIAAGASDARLLELLPPAVLDYIRRHHLYRD